MSEFEGLKVGDEVFLIFKNTVTMESVIKKGIVSHLTPTGRIVVDYAGTKYSFTQNGDEICVNSFSYRYTYIKPLSNEAAMQLYVEQLDKAMVAQLRTSIIKQIKQCNDHDVLQLVTLMLSKKEEAKKDIEN